jgi:hypothetical protein
MEMDIATKLDRIEAMLAALVERERARRWYTTGQFAKTVGLAEFTVREHCRLGRLNARKRRSGRGPHAAWAIAHQELRRYQQHGLLPRSQ